MASVRRTTVAAVLAVVPLALAGCGADEEPREPADLTPEGIAVVVADHVDRKPRRVAAWDVMTRELEVEAPGAMLVYRRGTSLRVAVAPTTDSPLVCGDESFFDECVDLDDGDGHRLVLAWQELEPEEDPGIVFVIDRRDGEDVVADYSGVSITGDPRDLDLGITLEEMAAIVTDERLTLG